MDPMHKSVRNVLMNELGVTREVVRQEVVDIVATTARGYLDQLFQSGWLERIVRAEIEKLLKPEKLPGNMYFSKTEIERIIYEEAKRQIHVVLDRHLRFEVVPKP